MNELRVAHQSELQVLRYAELQRFILGLSGRCFKNGHVLSPFDYMNSVWGCDGLGLRGAGRTGGLSKLPFHLPNSRETCKSAQRKSAHKNRKVPEAKGVTILLTVFYA